jgi:hypothetical protein
VEARGRRRPGGDAPGPTRTTRTAREGLGADSEEGLRVARAPGLRRADRAHARRGAGRGGHSAPARPGRAPLSRLVRRRCSGRIARRTVARGAGRGAGRGGHSARALGLCRADCAQGGAAISAAGPRARGESERPALLATPAVLPFRGTERPPPARHTGGTAVPRHRATAGVGESGQSFRVALSKLVRLRRRGTYVYPQPSMANCRCSTSFHCCWRALHGAHSRVGSVKTRRFEGEPMSKEVPAGGSGREMLDGGKRRDFLWLSHARVALNSISKLHCSARRQCNTQGRETEGRRKMRGEGFLDAGA